MNGSGSLSGDPPMWQGIIDSGPMTGGTFVIEIDDTGWPVDNPGTPQDERWDYILATYFQYDPIYHGMHWDGYFPATGSLIPVVTFRFTNGSDRIGGVIAKLTITILDSDEDGMVDQDELANQTVSANFMIHVEQCEGAYEGKCGPGSGNGNIENFDPNMDDLFTMPVGTLYLLSSGCPVPVNELTWGAVKTLYE